jgi:hypothetical protein
MTAIHDDKKLHFDLNLLEFALRKTIEICNAESEILTKIADINVETLEEIYEEKEDLMNFIDWHIPLIVRYIKMHKNDLDDIADIYNLAIRASAMNATYNTATIKMLSSKQPNQVIGNDKISTLTIMHDVDGLKTILDIIFINDTDEMLNTISRLMQDMLVALEINANKIAARKNVNDQILTLMSDTLKVAKKQKESYNPRRKKIPVYSGNDESVIYNKDC